MISMFELLDLIGRQSRSRFSLVWGTGRGTSGEIAVLDDVMHAGMEPKWLKRHSWLVLNKKQSMSRRALTREPAADMFAATCRHDQARCMV